MGANFQEPSCEGIKMNLWRTAQNSRARSRSQEAQSQAQDLHHEVGHPPCTLAARWPLGGTGQQRRETVLPHRDRVSLSTRRFPVLGLRLYFKSSLLAVFFSQGLP